MWHHRSLTAAVLLAVAVATASANFGRQGCGCRGNAYGGLLTAAELKQIRQALVANNVADVSVYTDNVLQAGLQYILLNNFPGVVPGDRDGLIEIYLSLLNQLPQSNQLTGQQVTEIATDLRTSSGLSAAYGFNAQLIDVVPASSLLLSLRNIEVGPSQLKVVLQNAVNSFIGGPQFTPSASALSQLLAYLDSTDLRLAQIVQLEELNSVRESLQTQFQIANINFDQRYQAAIQDFEASRSYILSSLNGLISRGPNYELEIQGAIARLVQQFGGLGINDATARLVLQLLLVTNTAGGQGSPADALQLIVSQNIDSVLMKLSAPEIVRIQEQLTTDLTSAQISEAYGIFLMGLLSQGVTPAPTPRAEVLKIFTDQLKLFVGSNLVYEPRNYFLFTTRISVPQIPRGSGAFTIGIFDPQVVVNRVVLVAQPLQSIYVEGRRSFITDVVGIQGTSASILNQIASGSIVQSRVENIVNLKPRIESGNLPKYAAYVYGNFKISGRDYYRISVALTSRFPALVVRSYQEPIVQLILQALNSGSRPLPTSSGALTSFIVSYLSNLPAFQLADEATFGGFTANLGSSGVNINAPALNVGYQQFVLASQVLGYQAPQAVFPNIFQQSLRLYRGSTSAPQITELGPAYVSFLFNNLGKVFQQVQLINNQLILSDDQIKVIFSSLQGIQPSLQAQRAIIYLILGSLPDDTISQLKTSDAAIKAFQDKLKEVIAKYSVSSYILSPDVISKIASSVNGATAQQVIDANAIAFSGLAVRGILPSARTFEDFIVSNINSFSRIHSPKYLSSLLFGRRLIQRRGRRVVIPVSVTQVDPPAPPAIVEPPPPPPAITIPGVNLQISNPDFVQISNQVIGRFPFLNRGSVPETVGHVIAILQASGEVTGATVSSQVRSYLSSLPDDLTVTVNSDTLSRIIGNVDTDSSVTVTGNGVRAGIAGVVFSHLAQPQPLPVPTADQQASYFSFLINRYRPTISSRFLNFGAPFAGFLGGYLPQLPRAAGRFSIFNVPSLYSSYSPFFSRFSRVTDLPLYTQVFSRGSSASLSAVLKAAANLNDENLSQGFFQLLSDGELAKIIELGKQFGISSSITGPMYRRAFSPCRLALKLQLSGVLRSRSDVLGFIRQLLQRHGSGYTPSSFLSSQLITDLQALIQARLAPRQIKIIRPIGGIFKGHSHSHSG